MLRFYHRFSIFALLIAFLAIGNTTVAPAAKYHDCHGYVRHVSMDNVRVHCIDGTPKDISFVTWPKEVNLKSGKTLESKALKPGTPVHVIYTETLGVRHAYKVYIADPNGHGLYGFKA